jgi:phage FluMu protein Com
MAIRNKNILPTEFEFRVDHDYLKANCPKCLNPATIRYEGLDVEVPHLTLECPKCKLKSFPRLKLYRSEGFPGK